jgi:phosphoglycerate dehydrogenase-like enzyme
MSDAGRDASPGTILITSYLEPDLVERIGSSWDGSVLYDPCLVPKPRYVADHGGTRPVLSPGDEQRWQDWLGRADICFDFDWWQPEHMLDNCPRLRWVQATSAGIGGFVRRFGLDRTDVVFSTAAGTHAVPLAEFALTGALYLVKGVPDLLERQRRHDWERYTTRLLAGRRVTVVGLGEIGRHCAQVFAAVSCSVTGVTRPGGRQPDLAGIATIDTDGLDAILPDTDVLVLATPLTPQTTGLIDRRRLDALPPGAIVINIARGPVLDNQALVDVLHHGLPGGGRLGGAVLDVTDPEPLPSESPLWDRTDVLISPHSASTVATENALIVELFLDNLIRWRNGRPLRNTYDRDLGY